METKGNNKVVLIDDDNFLLEMYALKFKKNGYEVETFTAGESLIAAIKDGLKPNILLCDLIMPKMDGFDVLKIINGEKLLPDAVKIVLTNQGQQSDIEKAEAIGVDGYIIKALHTPSEVVEKVKEIFANKKR